MMNIFIIIINLFFLKKSWLKVICFFKHRAILANFVSPNGKIKTIQVTPENNKFKFGTGEYIVDETKAYFESPSKTPIYYYNVDDSEPLTFSKKDQTINPEFLDNLLLMAKASGSVDWISKLVKFKWLILSFIVIAAGTAYLIWKVNDLQTAISSVRVAVDAIRNTNLVG